MRRRILVGLAMLVVLPWVLWLVPNRVYYRRGRPTRIGRGVNAFSSWLYERGFLPSFMASLETVGWRTGAPHRIPVVIADYAGQQYIVSMLGERSPWVWNIRASGGRAAIVRRGRHEVLLDEVPVAERAPILKAYVGRAFGARPHITVDPRAPVAAFEDIAADYPVFRISEPARASAAAPIETGV